MEVVITDEHEDNLICDVCGGCRIHTCTCPGGPRGPKLHTRLDDEPHRDDAKDN